MFLMLCINLFSERVSLGVINTPSLDGLFPKGCCSFSHVRLTIKCSKRDKLAQHGVKKH